MIKTLLLHHWKSTWRSPDRGKNILSAILFGSLMVVLLLYCSLAGYFLPDLFKETLPKKDPVMLFSGAIIYIVVISFFLRTVIQGIPSQAIDYYRALPVKRESLINTLLIKVLMNEFNLAFLFFMIPFAFRTVFVEYSFLSAFAWFVSIILIEISNGYFAFYLKKKIFSKPSILIPAAIAILVVIVMEVFTSVSVGYYSSQIFGVVLTYPFLVLVPILLFGLVYMTNYRHIMSYFYPEDLTVGRKTKIKSFSRYSFLENFGELGSYMALELKMIFRNKRPRAMFYYSFIFVIYPLITYQQYFDHSTEVQPASMSYQVSDSARAMNRLNNVKVTFNVISNVPDNSFVFIRGGGNELGDWKPNKVNLFKGKNNVWSRTFYFEKGKVLGYQFTLGSEETKALDDSHKVLDKRFATLLNDTTVTVKISRWQKPPARAISGFLIIFWSVFIVGAPVIMYGQSIFSWDGNYFDFLLAHKINFSKYLYAKYFVMVLGCLLFYVLTLPYIFFGIKVLWFHTSALLFNMGYFSFATILMGVFNKRRMDLGASMMSYQGREGGMQLLRGLVLIVLIGWIYFAAKLLGLEEYAFYIYALFGIAGILFNKKLIDLALKIFLKRRYKMAVGFRQG